MNLKKLIIFQIFFIFLINCSQGEKLGTSWHFDTKILRNQKLTKNKLLQEGFEQIYFESEQNITITGLFLERKNSTCTIIFSHGFCPGGKEVFAPFVKIAPENCNLLFLDLMGYGESEGPSLFSNAKNYGKNDYKAIVSAIKFVNKKTYAKPIIIFGWCSGAFNSATAVIHLKNDLQKLHVIGLIFDSGFGSIIEMSHIPFLHLDNKYIPKFVLKLYGGDKKRAKQSYLCKFSTLCCKSFLHTINLFIKPSIRKREPETNLYDKIQTIEIPVFIIHTQDDNYAPWENVQKLVEKIPQKELWIIENDRSLHAANHLKLKDEYKEHMGIWINEIISKNTLT